MVLKDGAAVRQERLKLLMGLIEKNQDTMTEKKMKGIFMLKTGLTRRKIDEYFEDLVDVEIIERKNGKVRTCR
jgi:hypothetical protein